ncbi:MAG: T9SS type A sorting domain-containing protein [Saprospiraceae bacterium]|nr:T9SS type A sorting domain-containing protein [Saprospiraceae bacterium]MCF8250873.1 T9SS type A sorting domain-containing protein [Saprospiraceae bacterium]MCF8281129.1 T9SS type A sorting domain-containing protein [Bacteroidales bacterium]MCF8312726.1 T9SS type A sorting domain-containing protein [Saprospiraceae bacterium]MCF8441173.1 T9SS type A sorting domain-containing protein [Saprospiraceae bacterium]
MTIYRQYLVSSLFLLLAMYVNAQKHDYFWVMGYSSSSTTTAQGGTDIDFNYSPPDTSYVFRAMNIGYNCASVCDKDGNLLFYTNGCYIAGPDNLPVMNGGGLNPGWVADEYCEYGYLAVQGSMFIPLPGSDHLYHLFHLGLEWVDGIGGVSNFLYHSVIDQSLDNGHGEVVNKNSVLLTDTLAVGKLTATKHANGRDWWIMTQKMFSDTYYSFLFGPDSIQGPFEQHIGPANMDDNGTGQAVFSPDGSAYAHYDIYNHLNIFDFDRCSGLLSNPVHIQIPEFGDTLPSVGGLAISPNSRFLYVSNTYKVYQFDLWADPVALSKKTVGVYDGYASPFGSAFFSCQLAPDHKIYINCPGGENVMHVITEPDKEGLACGFAQHSFPLPTYNGASMPNFPNYRLGPLVDSPCDTLDYVGAAGEGFPVQSLLALFPNPASQYVTADLTLPDYSGQHKTELLLFNPLGQAVASHILAPYSSLHRFEVGGLPSGIYLVVLKMDGKVVGLEKVGIFR